MVLNMGLPDLPDPTSIYSSGLLPHNKVSPWLEEYIKGCNKEIYGFLPGIKFRGITFSKAVVAIAKESGCLLLGAHIDGAIRINPREHVLTPSTVLFALCAEQNDLDCVAFNRSSAVSSWIGIFQKNRKEGTNDR